MVPQAGPGSVETEVLQDSGRDRNQSGSSSEHSKPTPASIQGTEYRISAAEADWEVKPSRGRQLSEKGGAKGTAESGVAIPQDKRERFRRVQRSRELGWG